MILYTGTGDDGTSGLYGSSKRFSKEHVIYQALGDVDELNSYIGLCRAYAQTAHGIPGERERFRQMLFQTQECLFIIQAELARADKSLTSEHVKTLEEDIDYIATYMSPQNSFVIPGASVLSAQFDVVRAIARRAERSVVSAHKIYPISQYTLTYLNRLSSLWYACARSTAKTDEDRPSYT